MSALFVDTSALAKRYLIEVGSPWITRMLDAATGNVAIITDVTSVELFSLLSRRVREGTLPVADLTTLGDAFLLHTENEYLTVPLDKDVLARARSLVERHPLRALDAI